MIFLTFFFASLLPESNTVVKLDKMVEYWYIDRLSIIDKYINNNYVSLIERNNNDVILNTVTKLTVINLYIF